MPVEGLALGDVVRGACQCSSLSVLYAAPRGLRAYPQQLRRRVVHERRLQPARLVLRTDTVGPFRGRALVVNLEPILWSSATR